ncbi:MAG: type II toxin-antitoxin system RelE/ParE family toxin [Gemmataceae bacterium]
MTLRLLAAAWGDAYDIAAWYEQRTPGAGQRFFTLLDRTGLRLLRHPRLYARAARPPRGREIRVAPMLVFPYRLTYEVTPTEIVVLSITHYKRRSQPWRRRLP